MCGIWYNTTKLERGNALSIVNIFERESQKISDPLDTSFVNHGFNFSKQISFWEALSSPFSILTFQSPSPACNRRDRGLQGQDIRVVTTQPRQIMYGIRQPCLLGDQRCRLHLGPNKTTLEEVGKILIVRTCADRMNVVSFSESIQSSLFRIDRAERTQKL